MNAQFVKARAMQSDSIQNIRKMASDQGLATTIIEYRDEDPLWKNAGTYLIVSPNASYIRDIEIQDGAIDDLLEEKRQMGEGSFNPYYQVFDISEFWNYEHFDKAMTMMRKIQQQAVVINIFNSFGYEKLPVQIHQSAIWEMQRMASYAEDESLPKNVRNRYARSYEKFVKEVYKKYMKVSEEKLLDNGRNQQVSEKIFINNRVDTTHETMSNYFRPYFEERVKDFPEFFYCIRMKPILQLQDLSMKTLADGSRPWSKEKGLTEWDIMIPTCYKHIYYQIMMEYNIKKAHCNSEERLSRVADPRDCGYIRINWYDLDNWDSLCKANGVKYYINHGDLETLDAKSVENVLVAINSKDFDMVCAIAERIERETVAVRSISPEEVAKSKAKVEKKLSIEKKNVALGFDHWKTVNVPIRKSQERALEL